MPYVHPMLREQHGAAVRVQAAARGRQIRSVTSEVEDFHKMMYRISLARRAAVVMQSWARGKRGRARTIARRSALGIPLPSQPPPSVPPSPPAPPPAEPARVRIALAGPSGLATRVTIEAIAGAEAIISSAALMPQSRAAAASGPARVRIALTGSSDLHTRVFIDVQEEAEEVDPLTTYIHADVAYSLTDRGDPKLKLALPQSAPPPSGERALSHRPPPDDWRSFSMSMCCASRQKAGAFEMPLLASLMLRYLPTGLRPEQA